MYKMKNCIRLKTPERAKAAKIMLLPMGYVTELAKICGCTRATVFNALRKNARGEKCDRVRRVFRAKYAEYLGSSEERFLTE